MVGLGDKKWSEKIQRDQELAKTEMFQRAILFSDSTKTDSKCVLKLKLHLKHFPLKLLVLGLSIFTQNCPKRLKMKSLRKVFRSYFWNRFRIVQNVFKITKPYFDFFTVNAIQCGFLRIQCGRSQT